MTKRVGYTKSPHTHLLSHATLKTRMCVCVCNDRRWVTIELEMLLKSFNWYATTQQRLNRQYFFSFFFFLFCSTVKLSPEGILNRPHRELLPPPTSYNSYYKMGFPMENAPAGNLLSKELDCHVNRRASIIILNYWRESHNLSRRPRLNFTYVQWNANAQSGMNKIIWSRFFFLIRILFGFSVYGCLELCFRGISRIESRLHFVES
jgi:hypothetical protein